MKLSEIKTEQIRRELLEILTTATNGMSEEQLKGPIKVLEKNGIPGADEMSKQDHIELIKLMIDSMSREELVLTVDKVLDSLISNKLSQPH